MDRIKINTYYVWLSKTGFTHWILLTIAVASKIELYNVLRLMKETYGDVGQIFATINCPKEYLIMIGENDDVYEFVQEQE